MRGKNKKKAVEIFNRSLELSMDRSAMLDEAHRRKQKERGKGSEIKIRIKRQERGARTLQESGFQERHFGCRILEAGGI